MFDSGVDPLVDNLESGDALPNCLSSSTVEGEFDFNYNNVADVNKEDFFPLSAFVNEDDLNVSDKIFHRGPSGVVQIPVVTKIEEDRISDTQKAVSSKFNDGQYTTMPSFGKQPPSLASAPRSLFETATSRVSVPGMTPCVKLVALSKRMKNIAKAMEAVAILKERHA